MYLLLIILELYCLICYYISVASIMLIRRGLRREAPGFLPSKDGITLRLSDWKQRLTSTRKGKRDNRMAVKAAEDIRTLASVSLPGCIGLELHCLNLNWVVFDLRQHGTSWVYDSPAEHWKAFCHHYLSDQVDQWVRNLRTDQSSGVTSGSPKRRETHGDGVSIVLKWPGQCLVHGEGALVLAVVKAASLLK